VMESRLIYDTRWAGVNHGRLVYVEGGIGSGKTTYVREVGPRLNYRVIKEPVDKAHLDRFYSNPKGYAYQLQLHLLHRRIGLQMLAACEALYSDTYDGAMVDRSVFGDATFEAMHYEDGNITELDHQTYRAALKNMKLMLFPPTTLIYIDAQPETCLRRIRERAEKEDRPYESGITLEYLRRLQGHYKQLLRSAKEGQWPWGHCVDIVHVQGDLERRTPAEWDAVAQGLKEQWT